MVSRARWGRVARHHHCHRGCVARPLTLTTLCRACSRCLWPGGRAAPAARGVSSETWHLQTECCVCLVAPFHILYEPGPCPPYRRRRKAQRQQLRRDTGAWRLTPGGHLGAALGRPHRRQPRPLVSTQHRAGRAMAAPGGAGAGVGAGGSGWVSVLPPPGAAAVPRPGLRRASFFPHAQKVSEAGAVAARFWFWSGH